MENNFELHQTGRVNRQFQRNNNYANAFNASIQLSLTLETIISVES
jgi:hypothetical protein